MVRTYTPKVKMYTDLTIETAIEEVTRGAKVQPTAFVICYISGLVFKTFLFLLT